MKLIGAIAFTALVLSLPIRAEQGIKYFSNEVPIPACTKKEDYAKFKEVLRIRDRKMYRKMLKSKVCESVPAGSVFSKVQSADNLYTQIELVVKDKSRRSVWTKYLR